MKNWHNVPLSFKLVISSLLTVIFIMLGIDLWAKYTALEILGGLAYTMLVFSMSQDDIVKLRLWGAAAGTTFCIQFLISDLPLINVIGQGGLVLYGLFKAYRENEVKKEKA